jgi:peptidoglycan/LPS O-acetylase OafA/YrhL
MLSLLGVVLVLLLGLQAGPFVRFLSSPVLRWAGSRSFSIYLVHEPVIVGVALMTKADGPWPWAGTAAVAVPFVLLFAEFFHRVVERPAHRLSARLGRRIAAGVSDRTEDVVGPRI